ncbi:MAG TPA: 2-dehydropantoate 2-reductase [Pseudolabrys sp.]|nr:2-dehydropantoate 2-reductase [Pseudolabrys sp.]
MASAEFQRQSVAVVGLGSIGGIAAACLADAGRHDVIGCARRPLEHLVLERPDATLTVPLTVLTTPERAARVDWVLLCTKAHETPAAAPWLARLCDTATQVAVLQNGIDHVERVAPLARGASIVPVIVYYNGERLAPDHLRLRYVNDHELAVPDEPGGHAFASLMRGTPLRVKPDADFVTLKWRKLLLNAVANPITALTLQRQAVLRRADVYALCLDVLDEAVRIARADGANLADDEEARAMEKLMTFSPELGTSMYFDRLAGRPFEVEALNGAIVAAGERHGIRTPLNRMLLTLLRAINEAAAATPA